MEAANVKWMGEQKYLAMLPSGQAAGFDGDHKSAPSPMETLLGALGACTAIDVVTILKKKRQNLESLEVLVSGERAPEPPTVWTRLELLYRLRGALEEKAVRDAIELSEDKYCSVAAMLRKTAVVSFSFEILPPAEAASSVHPVRKPEPQ